MQIDLMVTFKTNKEFIDYLYTFEDPKYRDFHKSLLGTKNIKLIGVRTPILKKIAKQLSRDGYNKFKNINKHQFYEEDTITGLLIGYLNNPFSEILLYLDEFINYIDNWATCDIMCSNLKIFKSNLDEGFIYIKKIIKSNNPWKQRVAIVLLLNYYINNNYIDEIFDIIDNTKSDEYYVNMAISWLISYLYIFDKNKTKEYLKVAKINNFTYDKAIQKIRDSYKVSIEEKGYLKTIKR